MTEVADMRARDCKLVRLSGGASDGVVTCLHKDARSTTRPQGLYEQRSDELGKLPVFELLVF
jgi:hypothetical protein